MTQLKIFNLVVKTLERIWFLAFVRLVLSSWSRVASGAGLAACGGGRGEQALEFFVTVGEVSALRAVEWIAEGREGWGGALGLAEGTSWVQTWTREKRRKVRNIYYNIWKATFGEKKLYQLQNLEENRDIKKKKIKKKKSAEICRKILIIMCITHWHTHKQNTSRLPRQSCALTEAWLPVQSRCSVLLLIPFSKSAIHWEERGK